MRRAPHLLLPTGHRHERLSPAADAEAEHFPSGHSRRQSTIGRRLLRIGAALIILLALISLAGSPLATAFINHKLAALPQFQGRVDGVMLLPWSRTITIRGLTLVDREHVDEGNVVTVRQAELTLSLRSLLRGHLGGHGEIDALDATMIKRARDASQDGGDEPQGTRAWQAVLQKAFSLEVSRLAIKNSRVKFEDRTGDHPVALVVDRLSLRATMGSDNPTALADFPAEVELTARVGGSGHLAVIARANPASTPPHFYVKMELRALSLADNRDFLAVYAPVDGDNRTFDVFSELRGDAGHFTGYLEPSFHTDDSDELSNLTRAAALRAEANAAKPVTPVLKNEPDDDATKMPFEGDLAAADADVWTAIENLLRHAFVRSLHDGLEKQPSP